MFASKTNFVSEPIWKFSEIRNLFSRSDVHKKHFYIVEHDFENVNASRKL